MLNALLALLNTPANVGVERPSLKHFGIQASLAGGKVTPGQLGSGAGPGRFSPLLAGLSVGLLLAGLAAASARRRRTRLGRLGAIATIPLIVLAGVATVAAFRTTGAGPVRATVPAITAATAGSHSTTTSRDALSRGSALFNRLVVLETQIANGEAQLQSPSNAQGAGLLRQEHRLAVSLEDTLQQEYDFFAQTAREPHQAAALMQTSATQSATVRDVVSYDVQAVQLEQAQQAAITQASQSNVVGAPVTVTIPGGLPSGTTSTLAWPLNGAITQGFGPSPLSIEPSAKLAGVTYPHFHTGLDIASALGTPTRAAADGTVALAAAETDGQGHLVGFGNYVVIAHGGNVITLYGHLEQLLVHPGQTVHAGDPIGLEGSSGNSTGPHLHFEVRIGGVVTDPRTLLGSRFG